MREKQGDVGSRGRHSAALAAKGSSPGLLGEELGPVSRRPGHRAKRELAEEKGGDGVGRGRGCGEWELDLLGKH